MSASVSNERLATIEQRIARIERALGSVPAASAEVAVADIIQATAFQMGLRPADLIGAGRAARFVRARFAVAWVAQTVCGHSLKRIGRALGGRDHTTIINAVARAEQLLLVDPAFRLLTQRLADAARRAAMEVPPCQQQ
jgi:chromosomal replication initiation ATPase DnaA